MKCSYCFSFLMRMTLLSQLAACGSILSGCPEAPLRATAVIPEMDFTIAIPLEQITLNITAATSVLLSTNLTSSPEVLEVAPEDPATTLTLQVDTEQVNDGDRVDIHVAISANSTNSSDECSFLMLIAFVGETFCSSSTGSSDQRVSVLPVTRRLQTIHFTLNTSLDQLDEQLVRRGMAAVLDEYCPSDPQTTCEHCLMTSQCDISLDICQAFTFQYIFIIETADSVENGHSSSSSSVVTLAAEVPQGVVQSSSSTLPLLPAPALYQALTTHKDTFSALTGLQVSNVEVTGFPMDRRTFALIAAIILPVLVVTAVIALLGGIFFVVVIARLMKHRQGERKDRKQQQQNKKKKEMAIKREKKTKQKKKKMVKKVTVRSIA